jgi:signal transduction histidine kinase/ketosteroid isomerase-like protein
MDLRTLVARHHQIFNDRDLDAFSEVFAEDVEVMVDGKTLEGLAAVKRYCQAMFHEFPQLLIGETSFVAESADTIVSEYWLFNGDPSGGPVRRQGMGCEVYRVRDGRIVAAHSYYAAESEDHPDVVTVPQRAEQTRVAEGHAALRRVAMLVARGVSADELFAAVNEEVGWLVGADATFLVRFEADDTVTVVAAWAAAEARVPIGARRPVDEVLRALREDGAARRLRPHEIVGDDPFAREIRQLGVRSLVGVPIVNEGHVWGVAFAASARGERFDAGTIARITGFTNLVAIALANNQAAAELQSLVDEQRGLRRLAVLIASGATQAEVLDGVAAESARVLQQDWIALHRYDGNGFATVVAAHGGPAPLGQRMPLTPNGVTERVLKTGRPARVDHYAALPGAEVLSEYGVVAAVGAPIIVDGRAWGVLAVLSQEGRLPPGIEDRLAQFADLAATAIASAESRAALRASRARVVATADETRRRIERDLHDGAQQRLVHTIISLKLARRALGERDGTVATLIEESLENALRATDQLRELVHGILPGALRSGGLQAGVEALMRQMTIPVTVDVPDARLPEALETTAYFIVAETLTNVIKHADASRAHVTATIEDGALRLEVRDDGRGGADAARGTGLIGLVDRVDAAGGTMTIWSPAGDGTTIVASMPLEPPD